MANNITELIVKVGTKSSLSFSHSKAYRAITTSELVMIAEKFDTCRLIIIEDVKEEEYDELKEFVVSFLNKSDKNLVYFYSETEEYNDTQGLADELELDIFLNKDKLFRDIYNKTGTNISTDIAFRKEVNESNTDDAFDNAFDISFGTLTDEEKNLEIKEVPNEFENNNIDIDKENTEIKDTETPAELVEIKPDNGNNVELDTNETEVFVEQRPKVSITKHDTRELKNETNNKDVEIIDTNNSKDNIDNHEDNIDDNTDLIDYGDEEVKRLHEDIKELIEEIDAEKAKNKELSGIIDIANDRITELSLLNRALKDKYNSLKDNYDRVMESDEIIEDPIPLSEYQELQNIIKDSDNKVGLLENTIKELTLQIEEDKQVIEELNSDISKASDKIKDKNTELAELKEQIEKGLINSTQLDDANSKVKVLEDEVYSLSKELDSLREDATKLREKIDKKNDTIETYKENRNISIEFSSLLASILSSTITDLHNVEELNQQNIELIENLKQSDSGNSELLQEQAGEITKLQRELGDVHKSLDNVTFEKEKLEKKLGKLNQELEEHKEEIEKLEAQCEVLKSNQLFDEEGTKTLIETNNTLELLNESLRRNIHELQLDVEKIKSEKAVVDNTNRMLEEQNSKLRVNIQTITASKSSSIGNSGSNSIKPVNYKGRAFVIPVFGFGSQGITTTAISIARKLGMSAAVAFIDLDLVSPKADQWFRKSPICNAAPGFVPSDFNYTSMGLFFEKGVDFFINNANVLIHTVERTRNKGIDYISGVLKTYENYKIANADFNGLINYLGSIYDYIVIDLGKIGCSELNDSIIREFVKLTEENVQNGSSRRSVVVTSDNKFDIRNFRFKLDGAKIKTNNIAWLINLNMHGGLDDRTQINLGKSSYTTMPFLNSHYGNNVTFIESDKQSRDILDSFLRDSVCLRKEVH